MTASVSLVGLNKVYGGRHAVKELNLEIDAGSFTCLLGPSGCGKTTTLRMIAGFIEPDGGSVRIAGVPQEGIPPHKRNTSIVFQEYALFPHMTVRENVGYGLKVKGLRPAEVARRVGGMLDFLGLSPMADRFPRQLSGGQQQRVALGRSLVMEPDVLLMDEPLSNLDAKMRIHVRTEIKLIQRRLGLTTVYVTHDQEEALSISDKIAVMDQGELQQYGTPWELYHQPANRFVADFIGANNFLPVRVVDRANGLLTLSIGEQTVRVPAPGGEAVGDAAVLSLRPETVHIGDGPNRLTGTVKAHHFLGALVRYWLDLGPASLMVDDHDPKGRGILSGEVTVSFDPESARIFPAS
jgi:iron(III) transport system ATP-binding protein